EPRQREVERDPHAIVAIAQQESFFGMKGFGFFERVSQPGESTLVLGAEKIAGLHAEQLFARESAQALRHRVHIEDLLRLRLNEEKRIAGFLKKRLGQFSEVVRVHGRFLNSSGPTSPERKRWDRRPEPIRLRYWAGR